MKHYQLISITAALSLHSCGAFSPARAITRRSPFPALYYSDVAEHIAVEAETNVELFDSHQTSKIWQSLIPLIPGNHGTDLTVHWTLAEEGSALLLQHLFPNDKRTRQELQPLLHESFSTFQALVPSFEKYKARIVATRGPSGTKCPRWHVDHVPMRWIQALVGPGCDYVVGSDGIQWEAVNGMEVVESEDANQELVNEEIATVRHAPQGQGVVLCGAENEGGRFPAVHKSPSLGPFQGRVLLTLDVVQD